MGDAPRRRGFPAHAGMDPERDQGLHEQTRFPRTRGDGPGHRWPSAIRRSVSPHTRGWTVGPGKAAGDDEGFPAHAGMDPVPRVEAPAAHGFPRTRGDGPLATAPRAASCLVSPHTRGWTVGQLLLGRLSPGFPAHAGMDPYRSTRSCTSTGFPRTRGDGPVASPRCGCPEWVSPHTRGWTQFLL